jgi:hypothetical protein
LLGEVGGVERERGEESISTVLTKLPSARGANVTWRFSLDGGVSGGGGTPVGGIILLLLLLLLMLLLLLLLLYRTEWNALGSPFSFYRGAPTAPAAAAAAD